MSDDVLVVGGGIEGYLAALSARRADPAASVRVLASDGRFDVETGLIDLIGYEPGSSELVADPIAAIERLPAEHWYTKLGLETVREALSLFDDVTGDRYVGGETGRNALFPTATGRVAPAARYPESFAAGLASAGETMRLVGFERIADFDAELAAERLDERLPSDVDGTTVTTSLAVSEPPVAPEMAALLDGETDEKPRRESLVATLKPELDTEPRVGVPAVLGEEEARSIRESISEALHADIFEIPLGPPSVTGRRLELLLEDELNEHDISIERGVSVADVDVRDGAIEGISTENMSDSDGVGETTYEASAFVLATGGIRDGGLEGTRREVTEPIFDCPVSVPIGGELLTARDFLGDHPAVRAGIVADETLQPVSKDDEIRYENLYAAGRILESSNVVAERSTSGLSIVTGFEAGRRAVE